MSSVLQMRLHEGDVDWFIDQHTTAAMELLSLLMLMSHTKVPNGQVQVRPRPKNEIEVEPDTTRHDTHDTGPLCEPAEIWKTYPYGTATSVVQDGIRRFRGDTADQLMHMGAKVGAMAWRFDTNGHEIKKWTGQEERTMEYRPAVVPSAEECLRTINAFLVTQTSRKDAVKERANAPTVPSRRAYLYCILLENFTSIDGVNMKVFDAFVALHTPLFEHIQELMHIAISRFQAGVAPGAANKQWTATMAIISKQLTRVDVTPRYRAKILLEFFGPVWPGMIWTYSDLATFRCYSHLSARALVHLAINTCGAGENRREGPQAILNFTAVDSPQEPQPGKSAPGPDPLIYVALVLAGVAILLGVGSLVVAWRSRKKTEPSDIEFSNITSGKK